jgi:hypothetical protein
LLIEKEFEVELAPDNKEGNIRPVKIFTVGNKIELIAVNVDKASEQFNIYNWEFNLQDFAILTKNRKLASFPYSKNSKYEHLVGVNKATRHVAICVAERKGKKSTDCALHVVSCDNNMKTLFKQSIDFSLNYSREMLTGMQVSNTGEAWTLIAGNDKKGEISNQVIYAGKEKINVFPLAQNGKAIVNAGIAINITNNDIYVAGLIKADNEFTEMVLSEMDKTGKMTVLNTVDLKKELTGVNEAGSEFGKDNRVQQVLVRDNGIVDVLTIDQSSKEVPGNGNVQAFDTRSQFGDIRLFSFIKNKLANVKTLRRNITEQQRGTTYFNYHLRAYSVPAAFSKNNDLYFLYLANTSNADGTNNDLKLKKESTSQCLFAVAKMDENFKLKSQTLFDYTERKDNFDSYGNMIFCSSSDTRYFGYHETEFGLYTKAKLLFALMELK